MLKFMNLMPQVFYQADIETGEITDTSGIPDDIGVEGAPTSEGGDGSGAGPTIGEAEKSLADLDESAWDEQGNKPPEDPEPGEKAKDGDDTKSEATPGEKPEGEAKPEGDAQPTALEAQIKEAVDAALADQTSIGNENFERMKMLMESAGSDLKGDNMGEMLDDMEERILEHRRNPKDSQDDRAGAGSTQQGAAGDVPSTLDGVFDKYADKMDFGENLKGFYGDIVGLIANAATGAINERLGSYEKMQELTQARGWYDQAKAAAGDGPFPTFREGFNMLQLNPDFVTKALERFEAFKDVDYNPMAEAGKKWLAMKSPVGITLGQQRQADAEAKKVRDFKRLGKATRIPAAGKKPSEELAAMADAMDDIPFEKWG